MIEKFEELYELFYGKASEKHPVFQAAKIAEETGEAIKLVFKLVGFRREKYNVERIKQKLSDELADVVITTFVCAKICGVDLWKAVNRKLDTEIRRWKEFKPPQGSSARKKTEAREYCNIHGLLECCPPSVSEYCLSGDVVRCWRG